MFFKKNKNQDYAKLASEYDTLVNKYNELSKDHNATNEKYDKLLEEHIEVKKQLNKWTENQYGRKTKVDESMISKIIELKEQGYSNIKIGKELSVSEGTIRNIIKRLKETEMKKSIRF